MRLFTRLAVALPAALLLALLAFPSGASACQRAHTLESQRGGTTLFNPDCGSAIPLFGEAEVIITDQPDHGTLVRLSEAEELAMDDQYVFRYTAEPGFEGVDHFTFQEGSAGGPGEAESVGGGGPAVEGVGDSHVIDVEVGLPSCGVIDDQFNIGGAPRAMRFSCGDPDGDSITVSVGSQPSRGSLGTIAFYPDPDGPDEFDGDTSWYCGIYTPPASGPEETIPVSVTIDDGHPGGAVTRDDNVIHLVNSGATPRASCAQDVPSPPDPCEETDTCDGPGPVGPAPPGPSGGSSPVGGAAPSASSSGGSGPAAGKSSVAGTQKGKSGQVTGSTVVNYNGSTVDLTVTGKSGPGGSIAKAVRLGSAKKRNVKRGTLRWVVKFNRAGRSALTKGLKRKRTVKVKVTIKVTPPAGSGGKPSTITKTVTLKR